MGAIQVKRARLAAEQSHSTTCPRFTLETRLEGVMNTEQKTVNQMMRAAMQAAAQRVADEYIDKQDLDQVFDDWFHSTSKLMQSSAMDYAKARLRRKMDAAMDKVIEDFAVFAEHEVRVLIRQKIVESGLDDRAQRLVQSAIDTMNRVSP
jgi:hypothetical protein